MEISELNKVLRTKAIEAGLCDDWQNNIWNRDLSLDELLTIYIRGIDFSLKQEWFDYDFIKEEFPADILHRHNIYLDEYISIGDASSGTWVFIGNCEGEITFKDFSVGTLYLRHNSRIKVVTKDMAKVFISLYDESEVDVEQLEYSTAKVYDRHRK